MNKIPGENFAFIKVLIYFLRALKILDLHEIMRVKTAFELEHFQQKIAINEFLTIYFVGY